MERTCELIRQAKEGSSKARSQLVEENAGLIWSVARRFQGRGYDLDDLFQIGTIGLLKCIDNFDFDREVRLSTYAVPLIMGEIRRYIRDDGIMKVSRTLKEISYRIYKEKERCKKEDLEEPTIDELSRSLNLSREDILMAMESGQEVRSLHQVIYQGDGDEICLEDRLVSSHDEIGHMERRLYLDQLLSTLTAEEQSLIRQRYFQGKTQTVLAGEMGISQVQVSRMEKKILKKLREADRRR
ncbi:MAG: SigB/SigF/SigG family RNA polymerase sigma factor [Eubacterium sp.]|nr:SigB/SigF/SigG family RNA polymerase sigma factor [Eubacterium sp.]